MFIRLNSTLRRLPIVKPIIWADAGPPGRGEEQGILPSGPQTTPLQLALHRPNLLSVLPPANVHLYCVETHIRCTYPLEGAGERTVEKGVYQMYPLPLHRPHNL